MEAAQPQNQEISQSPMDMNPNEAVTESGTEKVVNDERLSWDDLEKIESNAEKKEAETKKEAKKTERATTKEAKEPKEDTKETKDTDQTDQELKKEITKATFSKKGFKVNLGKDKGTVDIPPDTIFSIKSDGEVKEMPLQEIINRASGDVAVETRLNQVSEMDKGIRQAGEKLRQHAVDTIETIKADPIAGLEMIAQIAGDENPQEFASLFFGKLQEMASQIVGMSEAEQRAYMAEMKLKSRDTRDQLSRQREERQYQTQQQMQQTQQIMQKYGMTQQDWFDSKQELVNNGMPENEITPDAIVRQNAEYNVFNMIKEGVPELYAKRHDPKMGEILQESFEDLTDLYVSGDTDKEGLIELVRETLSPFLEEKPEEKVDEDVRKLNEKLENESQTRLAKADNSDPTKVRSEKMHELTDAIWSI